jgi:nitrogen regulatory protein P-II 1
MREIKAIIQPFMLDEVLFALEKVDDLPGLTLSAVQGWGRSRARNANDIVAIGEHHFARKMKLEVVVPDSLADIVADTITRAARTGKPGDGKVFVSDVRKSIRVRTGELVRVERVCRLCFCSGPWPHP